MGSPLTLYVPYSVESLLNSHHTQHYSISWLASCEALLLCAPNITLVQRNNLNPATLLPTLQEENNHRLFTDYLLAPRNDLQETLIDNTDLIRFTDWWNKIHILRQDKKNPKIKFSLCLFGPPPFPLVCNVHLHYTLTRRPQWQKYLLNHKDQFFPSSSGISYVEDNIPCSIL